jgi:hypothetical protein
MFEKYLGDSKMFEYDKHYRECQQENRPFIKAKTSPVHKNYFVQIDLMTCNFELSKQEQTQIKKLVQEEADYVKSKHAYDFVGFNITSELSWFDGISSEHVDNFCNSLYDLIQKQHN